MPLERLRLHSGSAGHRRRSLARQHFGVLSTDSDVEATYTPSLLPQSL